jgi:polyhydroxybutyrate depolymerase
MSSSNRALPGKHGDSPRTVARPRVLLLAATLLLACGDDSTDQAPISVQAGSGGSVAATCIGKPGAVRGKSSQMVMAGGLARSFVYYAPASLDPNAPAPVVFIPHGYMMNADQMVDITQYAALAERERFIAIFPNGQGTGIAGPWNVGQAACTSSLGILPVAAGDDQAFIDAMLAFAEQDQCVDRSHVFVTGFSMGGYLANESACLRPEIRGIAPHSAGTHDLASCPVANKPVLIMHFEGDSLIPYSCGTQARDRWVARNGCQPLNPIVETVAGGRCEYYQGCAANGQVGMCTFTIPAGNGGSYPGHAWSGGSKDGTSGGSAYAIPETASASELSWAFFRKYAW